jgi:hypothetical protein
MLLLQFSEISKTNLLPEISMAGAIFSDTNKLESAFDTERQIPKDDQSGNLVFFILSFLSISPFFIFSTIVAKKIKKYRKRQNDLIDKNKNKDLFFSILSHDLKTPALNLISLS